MCREVRITIEDDGEEPRAEELCTVGELEAFAGAKLPDEAKGEGYADGAYGPESCLCVVDSDSDIIRLLAERLGRELEGGKVIKISIS